MTRLTDALERAGAAGAGAIPVTPARPVPVEVPADWQFEGVADGTEPEPAAPAPVAKTGSAEVRRIEAPPTAPLADAPFADTRNAEPRSSFGNGVVEKLVIEGQSDTVLVEQYRRMAAVLHHSQQQRQTRIVMIASAVPAEGKTLTATNLSLTLSQSYQKRVLLIDADLRRPTLHSLFGVPNDAGLSTSLVEPQLTRLPVRQVYNNLWLLPAGRPDPNPTSLLTSEAMKQLLLDAATQFDWVMVDTPPVGLMPDANLLAAMIDAAIVVVNAGATPYPLVQKAVASIGVDRVLGVVLNRAERSAAAGHYEYYSYYDAGDGAVNGNKSNKKGLALR